jgi:hypothetical protein
MTGNAFDRYAASAPPEAGDAGSMEERRRRFLVASEKVRRALEARGVTEEVMLRDFVEWRKARRQRRSNSAGRGTSAALRP